MGKTLFPKNDSAPQLSSLRGFFLMSTAVTNLLASITPPSISAKGTCSKRRRLRSALFYRG